MTRILLIALISAALAAAAGAQTLAFVGPDRDTLVEGDRYSIEWTSWGLKSLSIIAYGERTPLGGKSRGSFQIVVSPALPAEEAQRGWTVPWIDALRFNIKLKGYDHFGRLVQTSVRAYGFRPGTLANRFADGIYVDLQKRRDQRLYVQKGGRITHCYLTSSSARYDWRPPNTHPGALHDHAGVFKVLSKELNH